MNATKNLLLLPVLIAGFGAAPVSAQTFTTLHSFTGTDGVFGANTDGALPFGPLTLSINTLYGTTALGGSGSNGTVFSVNTDGTGFATLYSFTGQNDGGRPQGGVILSGNALYGTAPFGGSSGSGTIFSLGTNGTSFTTLYSFTAAASAGPSFINNGTALTNYDGFSLNAPLILSTNTLYGTAMFGGSYANGTVFALNTDGTGFRILHAFSVTPSLTNSDGARPNGGLILSSNTLYGTTSIGGWGDGAVFSLNTDGTGFKTLHIFTGDDGGHVPNGLTLSGDTLFGTTGSGGLWGFGTVFALKTDGSSFRMLHDFTDATYGPNQDGALPTAGVIASVNNTLYGTTTWGGLFGYGTVFALNTDGSGFTVLHSFAAISGGGVDGPYGDMYTNSDGATAVGLIQSGNTLYGTTLTGGDSANGTVFSISLPAKPAISMVGHQLVLAWPTNVTGSLQSTTNLASPIWTTNLPAPVVINGQYTVTNPISGTQQFFRLSQ